MKLTLKDSDSIDSVEVLAHDFCSLGGDLDVDLSNAKFFKPPTLTVLYGLFKLHSKLCPENVRRCSPPSFKSMKTDVCRYLQRVNFFKCCPEFSELQKETFIRHDESGKFVPITEIFSMDDTDKCAEGIVKLIFPSPQTEGRAELKYILTELMDNSLQHSQTSIGCIAQTQPYSDGQVVGAILDAGIGMRAHLSRNKKIASQITSDSDALELALQPHISGTHYSSAVDVGRERDVAPQYHNAGLGLSICSEIIKLAGGSLYLVSGNAGVKVNSAGMTKFKVGGWPGTIIFFEINSRKCHIPGGIGGILKKFDIKRRSDHTLNITFKG